MAVLLESPKYCVFYVDHSMVFKFSVLIYWEIFLCILVSIFLLGYLIHSYGLNR